METVARPQGQVYDAYNVLSSYHLHLSCGLRITFIVKKSIANGGFGGGKTRTNKQKPVSAGYQLLPIPTLSSFIDVDDHSIFET